MRHFPVLASCVALVSVLTGSAAIAVGCGDRGPSTSGTATSSGSGGEASSSASASGTGGAAASSSSAAGTGGGASASSSSASASSSSASASSSSASASSSGASTSASTGSGSAGGLGDPCSTGADCAMPPPNSALFCDKPGCGGGMGTCALQPKSQLGLSPTAAPVCGCDNVTYWNSDYAAFHGISIASQGACPGATAVFCDESTLCPGTMKCNRLAAQCDPGAPGTCWSMPVSCPLGGASARACSNMTCQSVCDLIQSQNPWWNDATCP
ncbi:MAG: hypothetical protein ABJE95_03080 [Byssovorax sp.]